MTAIGGKFDPFTQKHISISSPSTVMEITGIVLQVKLSGQINKRSEEMGLCPNPWVPGMLLEIILLSS